MAPATEAGGVLEGGAWLLPHTEELSWAAQELATEIRRQGGTVTAFVAESLDGEQEEELRARFNQAREEEYQDLLRECEKLLAHVERETHEEDFEFLEVEEMEADLERVQQRLTQVQRRDIFGVPLQKAVEQRLQQCRDTLAHFTQETYERGHEGAP